MSNTSPLYIATGAGSFVLAEILGNSIMEPSVISTFVRGGLAGAAAYPIAYAMMGRDIQTTPSFYMIQGLVGGTVALVLSMILGSFLGGGIIQLLLTAAGVGLSVYGSAAMV